VLNVPLERGNRKGNRASREVFPLSAFSLRSVLDRELLAIERLVIIQSV
jgi:hypothetical protein